MASNNFANAAAAVAAGYAKNTLDRGAVIIEASGRLNGSVMPSERFVTTFTKMLGGHPGEPVTELRAVGYGADQATAEAAATTALNAQRINRYGGDSTAANASVVKPANKHVLDNT